MLSKEELLQRAKIYQCKPEILEKVYQLLSTLEQFMAVPYLSERLVLKGGTALNLFCFENIPRLSIDIDLNYIGHLDLLHMKEERPIINGAIHKIFQQNQFELYRNPNHHAGSKMIWRYPSAFGQKGNLEIDINYMHRQPLWPTTWLPSKVYLEKPAIVPVLDIHELASGKLSALFSRQASRDIFDSHYLLTKCKLDLSKLRLAFVIYISMTDTPLPNLTPDHINYNIIDMRNRLLPVLRQENLQRGSPTGMKVWANNLINELHEALSFIVPLKKEELNFISQIRTFGEIKPELITDDKSLKKRILSHPAIQWAVMKSRSTTLQT